MMVPRYSGLRKDSLLVGAIGAEEPEGSAQQAARWFEKPNTLDSRCAVAHLSLGDTYVKLGRKAAPRLDVVRNAQMAPPARNHRLPVRALACREIRMPGTMAPG
jgi:hypothetical protein